MIDKEIYREKIESSDIWGDDDEIETIPSSSASRPTTSSSNKTAFKEVVVEKPIPPK